MLPKPSVLVVDDESGIRESLTEVLSDEGYSTGIAKDGEECLSALSERRFDIILLDIWLPGIDGLETLEKIQALDNPPAVIMISGHGTVETAVRATKLGAFDFIEKPLSVEKTLLTIEHAAEQIVLSSQNLRLQEELDGRRRILGESVPMKALRQQIALAAPTNGRVLIFGESGAGKELVARALHRSSHRRQQPFVELNCAAIPEELIESELFGHVKGSFTGAVSDKAGKFALADGGTLFLDEIGDMSLRTQSKVLRVIEEQRFAPVGSGSTLSVDVRVIAATNKHLANEIEKGNFREDLFYRLNVIPFYVPALREHLEDVPELANHFLGDFSRLYGRRPKSFAAPALESLSAYRWPGNVRELRNLVERLVIMVPGIRVERRHLPPEFHEQPDRARPAKTPGASSSLHAARASYEREYILRKLGENQGNMTRTAAALGLERSHLYKKLRSLGISPGEN